MLDVINVVSNWGDIEAIQILVESGADINSVGILGNKETLWLKMELLQRGLLPGS